MSKKYMQSSNDLFSLMELFSRGNFKRAQKSFDIIEPANSNPVIREETNYEDFYTIHQTLLEAQEQHLKNKAFELIILKNVDVNEIRPNATAEAYNSKMPYYRQSLTDDEFKFLKEIVRRLDCQEVLFELPKY